MLCMEMGSDEMDVGGLLKVFMTENALCEGILSVLTNECPALLWLSVLH